MSHLTTSQSREAECLGVSLYRYSLYRNTS